MANWDVFHSDRLEIERDLTSGVVRTALTKGSLIHDDLIRPAGSTTAWTRIGDVPALAGIRPGSKPAAKAEPPAPVAPPVIVKPTPKPPSPPAPERDLPILDDAPPTAFFVDDDDDDEYVPTVEPLGFGVAEALIVDDDDDEDVPTVEPFGFGVAEVLIVPDDDEDDDDDDSPVLHVSVPNLTLPSSHSRETFGEFDVNLEDRAHDLDLDDDPSSAELVTWDDDLEYDPQEEDEAAAEFTLSRKSAETVEELDLAAMVDVAFQLVLFFLVTATTILYKSLEVPKPNPESNPAAAAAQGRPKSLDDMKETFILVEIDTAGAVKVDKEPVRADLKTLIETLRKARETTDRKAMLLSADFSTPHKSAVLAYDAANEIGLSIAIARPSPKAVGAGG